MPNMIACSKVCDLLEEKNNNVLYIIIYYTYTSHYAQIEDIKVIPLESIDWNCLRFGNLGEGQIQIKNTNKPIQIVENANYRENWLLDFVNKYITNQSLIKELKKLRNIRRKYGQVS